MKKWMQSKQQEKPAEYVQKEESEDEDSDMSGGNIGDKLFSNKKVEIEDVRQI